ncbi:hypothetical protein KMU_05940 [Proteus vulgaris]|uniref:hypothetical protein n=1 Tax=Proteus vulgaris TaxID=585 RepID=UPI002555912A|nr:hypothetical protein [Proteus vulgaris]GLX62554.1 hypothetical protein KMU_05940 [Proteus vulgaris]
MNDNDFKEIIKKNNAKIIHFSTIPRMNQRNSYFPDDLKNVISQRLPEKAILSCSCIYPGNVNHHLPGSIGIILDVDLQSIISVCDEDSGSYQSNDGIELSAGKKISYNNLLSIFKSTNESYNEFRIKIDNIGIGGLYVHNIYNPFYWGKVQLPDGSQEYEYGYVYTDINKLKKIFDTSIYTLTKNEWIEIVPK